MNQYTLVITITTFFLNTSSIFCNRNIPLEAGNAKYENLDTALGGLDFLNNLNISYLETIDSLKNTLNNENLHHKASNICKMGSVFYRNSCFNEGLECAERAYTIGQSLSDTVIIVRALRLFADNYYALARYEKSTDYFLKELEYHIQAGDTRKIAEVYCNIGVNFEERGMLEKGMYYYLEAMKKYEKIDDKEGIVATLCNLSFVYRNQGKNLKAIELLEKANRIEKQYLDIKKEHYYMANIADVYKNMGQYQVATTYLAKAAEMLEKIKFPDDEDLLIWADVAKAQADIFLTKDNKDSAFHKYNEALTIIRQTGYLEKKGNIIVALGAMYLKWGMYKNALRYLNEAEEIAVQTGSFYLEMDVYSALSETHAGLSNYKRAFHYEKLFHEASDSVLNIESAKQLANFQVMYEAGKKEAQIQLLKKEKEIQKLKLQKSEHQKTYFAIISLFFVSLLVIIFNRFRLKRRVAAELLLLNATKDKFFAIIAHDLRSPVSAFNSLAHQINSHFDTFPAQELKEYIAQLSSASASLLGMLKNLLEWSKSQRGQLNPVFKKVIPSVIIENAIKEEEMHMGIKNISIVVQMDENGPFLSDDYILGTVMRNILSNAIKFSPEGSKIEIVTRKSKQEFIFAIADEGPGLSEKDIDKLFRIDVDTKTIGGHENKGSGIGLIMCHEFVQKIGGRIWVDSRPGEGCTFFVAIPVYQKSNHVEIKQVVRHDQK